MASGNKVIIHNSRERIVSPDLNRAQGFSALQVAEIFRGLMGDSNGIDDLDGGGNESAPTTIASPVRAEILTGLRCTPQMGNTVVTVTPGVAFFLAPDNIAEDSRYKYVNDPGVTLSTLVIAPNPAGTIRIDVIECSWSAIISETDNRDILDLATGAFAPALVDKVRRGVLTYRVRQGTAGAGFPGTASGWLPLCVASVPPASVNNDTVTFWDVRPLVNDRAFGFSRTTNFKPIVRRSQINAVTLALVGGHVDAVLDGRRVGGALRSGTPSAALGVDPAIDFTAAANQASGFALAAKQPYYLYLATPFGLPRWARYTTTSPRVPQAPKGIPIVSNTYADLEGRPLTPINMPVATGLGSATMVAVAVAAGYVTSAGAMGQFYANDGEHQLVSTDASTTDPMSLNPTSNVTAAGVNTTRYDLTAGLHYPSHARKILVEFRGTFVTSNAALRSKDSCVFQLGIYGPAGGALLTRMWVGSTYESSDNSGVASGINLFQLVWINLPNLFPYYIGTTQRIDFFAQGNYLTSVVAPVMKVWGWKT